MRLAVLSDIHGNILALDRVMADLAEAGFADVIWVLGDLAAFGSSPEAVIQQVRNLPRVQVIQGNTDRYLVSGVRPAMPLPADEEAWSQMPARLAQRDAAFQWTCERLNFDHFTYLRDLPTELTIEVEGYGTLTAFHAAPGDDEFGFAPETEDAVVAEKLSGIPAGLVMMGHTHLPMDRQVGDWRVLNVGSIGMPFDGDPRAAYTLLDFDDEGRLTVDPRRVAYDVEKAVGYLQGLEHPLAELQSARLRSGLQNPPAPA
jgi:putative phosphoesterase